MINFWKRKKNYTILPLKVSKELYVEVCRLVAENKGNFILRFINDRDEEIDDLICDAKGFTNYRRKK